MLKKMLVSVLLIGFLFGLPMPVSVGAQGGEAVYKSLGVIGALRVGGTARFEGPVYGVGPQDVASDLLTSSINVMSSTYVTVMSGSVTTSEPGDSVLVHVTGQFRQMDPLYIVDSNEKLWRLDDLEDPSSAILKGSLPSDFTSLGGMLSKNGSLYMINNGSTPKQLWRLTDFSDPSSATLVDTFPSQISSVAGFTAHGGSFYILLTSRKLWSLDDLSDPSSATLVGTLPVWPSTYPSIAGFTSYGGSLWLTVRNSATNTTSTNTRFYRIDNPSTPSVIIDVGQTWATVSALVTFNEVVYALGFRGSNYTGAVSGFVSFPNLDSSRSPMFIGILPAGMSTIGDMAAVNPMGDCMVRLARGTTEIEGVSFPDRILFDNTVVDSPPVGTHTYAVQVRTVQPDGCTAYLGDGLVPMPSLFVQSYYGGTTP